MKIRNKDSFISFKLGVLLLIAWLDCMAVSQEVDIQSLHKELTSIEYKKFDFQEMSASPMFRTLAESATKNKLYELVAQRDYPSVSIAAFHAFKKRYLESAHIVAIDILSNTDNPSSPIFKTMWESLDSVNDLGQVNEVLQRLDELHRGDSKRELVILGSLPYELLNTWYHGIRDKTISVELECVVVCVIAGELRKKGVQMSEKMLQSLRSMKNGDTFMRLTFLTYMPEQEAEYTTLLRSLLEDTTMSKWESIALISSKADFINNSIDVESLNLPDDRKFFIGDCLQRLKGIKKISGN